MAERAVFLDRDNTLIDDPGYLSDPEGVHLLPGVEQALKLLAAAGYKLVVVTNQSGIARGMLTEATLARIHNAMRRKLSERGAYLDAIYYCPYHPDGTVEEFAADSEERKPRPGMLLRAGREMDLDLAGSWMVGDSPRDVGAGQQAGCRTVRIRQPEALADGDEEFEADYTVRNLLEAARIITGDDGRSPQIARLPEARPQSTPPAEDADSGNALAEIREELARLRQAVTPPAPSKAEKLGAGLALIVATYLGIASFIGAHRLVIRAHRLGSSSLAILAIAAVLGAHVLLQGRFRR